MADLQPILDLILENFPGNIYAITSRYELVFWKTAAFQPVGEPPSRLDGQLCYQVLYQQDAPCPGCQVADTLNMGKITQRTAARQVGLDPENIRTYEVRSFPLRDTFTRVEGALLIEQDMTDRRALEAALIQSGKLAALGQLAAGMAHEINNPLTAILANAQLLQREIPPGDDRLESVELIAMAGARAVQVVRNLLDFARKEGTQHIPTDLNATLRTALALVQHELVVQGVSLQFLPGENLPMLLAAPDGLQSVWLNLVINAIEAIDKPVGLIRVTSLCDHDNLIVVVADNGRGIPPNRLERIFEPFYTTKSPGQGTGLGLSVCRQIVEQHHGTISVDSQPGQGAEFRVTLPIS
jgi:two-component system NtrC family sensor kinase